MSASARCSTRVAKAASKSRRRASTTRMSRPSARPAASMSFFRSSKIGQLEGTERYAIVVACGISSSRLLHPERRRHGLDYAKLANSGGVAAYRRTATSVTPGAISLSSSSHFPPMLYSKFMKPVALPPGRARLSTKPAPTGSTTAQENNRYGAGRLQQRSRSWRQGQDDVGASAAIPPRACKSRRHRSSPSGCRCARCGRWSAKSASACRNAHVRL